MFHPPANLPSSWPKSTSHTAPHTGRSFPDPLNRSACARFRLRRKAPKTPFSHCRGVPPSNSDISQLWDATLDLSRRLNDLSNTVLDLATSVRDHLSCPCSLPVPVVSAAPLVNASLSQSGSRESKDDTIPSAGVSTQVHEIFSLDAPQAVRSPTPIASRADRLIHPVSPPAQCLTDNDQARATNVNVSQRSSLSATLPQLRGFFNKSRQKASNHQEASPGSSTKRG